eukprot:2862472-Pleurochrysis_carterae.AAC.1
MRARCGRFVVQTGSAAQIACGAWQARRAARLNHFAMHPCALWRKPSMRGLAQTARARLGASRSAAQKL